MLHSFMYHEHPMTEGCASPPPTTSSVQRSSPYYNIVSKYLNKNCYSAIATIKYFSKNAKVQKVTGEGAPIEKMKSTVMRVSQIKIN